MSNVKAIAFYLPQYHPIPENDRWWGKGFTEWTNVTRGRPFFPGHHQPQLPADLGYYDLRLPDVRAAQADLARRYGVHGFCYYYYWFNGRRLLERPLEDVLRTGEPDFPFCVCWANENWTRRWDGAEHEILMAQVHSPESDRRFIQDVLPLLRDPRYIRVGGAPLLLVYRAGVLPEPRRTTDIWREVARAEGLELHLAAVQTAGTDDPVAMGFDAAVEFPPLHFGPTKINEQVEGLSPEFRGWIYEYDEAIRASLAKPRPAHHWYRGVMTSWDNTARRGAAGHVYRGATPGAYERWLRAIVAETEAKCPPDERIVFVNAWNEWAEGAHLEPDQRFGHAWLEATARALRHRSDWREIVRAVREQPGVPPEVLRGYFADLEFALEAQERALQELERQASGASARHPGGAAAAFMPDPPPAIGTARLRNGGQIHLDEVGGGPAREPLKLRRSGRTRLAGWAFAPGIDLDAPGTSTHLVLRSRKERRMYYVPLGARTQRPDVAKHFPKVDSRCTNSSGFTAVVSTEAVPPGVYDLGAIVASGSQVVAAFCRHPITLE
jgi:hypothetical protein